MPRANYPATLNECIDPDMKHRREVVRAVKAFKRANPYRGTLSERKEKFRALHRELCTIYDLNSQLNFVNVRLGNHTGNGCCNIETKDITLFEKLSVITYLHEVAHAVFGSCERQAVRWSINLFRKTFPDQFARLSQDGHCARSAGRPRVGLQVGDHALGGVVSRVRNFNPEMSIQRVTVRRPRRTSARVIDQVVAEAREGIASAFRGSAMESSLDDDIRFRLNRRLPNMIGSSFEGAERACIDRSLDHLNTIRARRNDAPLTLEDFTE